MKITAVILCLMAITVHAQDFAKQFVTIENGTIAVTGERVHIRNDGDTLDLYVIDRDSLSGFIYMRVINATIVGMFWLTRDYGANLDMVVGDCTGAMRPKLKKYVFKKP
jgi:hypothetical protein